MILKNKIEDDKSSVNGNLITVFRFDFVLSGFSRLLAFQSLYNIYSIHLYMIARMQTL